MKTYEELSAGLEACALEAMDNKLSVREVIDRLEEGSYAFLCLLLTIPFLQPISMGPISAIGGLTFAVLGWQWANARPTLWIPDRLGSMRVSGRAWVSLFAGCSRILRFGRKVTRPRLAWFVDGKRGDLIAGSLMIGGGVLISLPFPGIPFNNTFPAMVIVFACIGWLEKDGLFTIIGAAWIPISLLYFGLIVTTLVVLGSKALDWLQNILR